MTVTTVGRIEIRPVTIPDSLTDPGVTDFYAMVDVRNRSRREVSGHDDYYQSAAASLPVFQSDAYRTQLWWVVAADGEILGLANAELPLEEGSRSAFWHIELLPELCGQGMGSRVYALIEQTANARGRTVLQAWAEHPGAQREGLAAQTESAEAQDGRVLASTGAGSISANDRAARFLVRHGYSLEQVERASVLDLTASARAANALLAKAQAAATGYRLVSWRPPTPPEFVAGYGWMLSRMSTDTPLGGLEWDEEAWDADRVALRDRQILDGGRTMLVTAAQHVASGELCAFTELVSGADHARATHQENTLVLAGHRGHSLGMLVKCANLLAWRELLPRSPRVFTFNAEENRPMLEINEALGFVPFAHRGAWKKVLTD